MADHKPGCEALGGYGHGVGPCTCGADTPAPVLTDEQIDAIADAHRWDTREGRRAMLRAVEHEARSSYVAMMQQALDAIDAEMSADWTCNSYHPKLHAARAALSATLEKTHAGN
jgi:hypothetical protein